MAMIDVSIESVQNTQETPAQQEQYVTRIRIHVTQSLELQPLLPATKGQVQAQAQRPHPLSEGRSLYLDM